MQYPDARILIFAKAPVPGYVKTRLIPALGAEGAASLYTGLLKQTVESVVAADLAPVQLWCAPDSANAFFQRLASQYDLLLCDQSGAGLGERMRHAAGLALNASDAVLLMGADCPLLSGIHLAQALQWLMDGEDAVLGPAEDGGYVLLGLRQNSAALFEEIPWGSDQVLELTRRRLAKLGWRWQELEPLWDLDRPVDFERWRRQQHQ